VILLVSAGGEWIDSVLEPAAGSGTTIDPCEVGFDYGATREECDRFLELGEVTAVDIGFSSR